MPLGFWIGLWKLVLIGGTGLFFLLAVVVTIGGARDVRQLLRTLLKEHARHQADDDE